MVNRILRVDIDPVLRFYIVILYWCTTTVYSEKGQSEIKACQDQSLLLGSDKNMAKVVDVPIGMAIHLECGFCKKPDNFQPNIWYITRRGENVPPEEVNIGMDNNEKKNKFKLTPSHTLTIQNFTLEDCAIYTCKRLRTEDDNIFTYAVDGVFEEDIMPKFGKIHNWNEYKRVNLDPINEKFEKIDIEPYTDMREFNFTFRLSTSWEPWSACESCSRRKGIRRRLGKCTLHCQPFTYSFNDTSKVQASSTAIKEITRYYLTDDYDISCRSLKLNDTFPKISEIVRKIPEFELRESCDDCALGGVDSSKRKDSYKYKLVKHVAEKSHLTLMCPETTLESSVEWYKDKKVLNDSFRDNMAEKEEPHLTIDAYNSLYILHATKNEEGMYSCTVDGRKMQKFDVRVVSQSKILNEEFIRYSIYLGFVLSMTITCFCAGLCVAWHRRSSFADPLNLKDGYKTTKSGITAEMEIEKERLLNK